MARTVQDVIDRAREVLQDADGSRYTAAQMTSHLYDALVTARSLRPDLFVGAYAVPIPEPGSLTPTTPLPLPDHVFAALAYYVCGACEMRDDEFAIDNRAMTLQAAYKNKLIAGS